MKKLFLFFALLAGIAVMTGCQKDQDVVTLKAVIGQDTKAYFGTPYQPYWDSDDQVYVAGLGINPGTYPLSFTETPPTTPTTFATIEGVSPSSVYCAIYPKTAVKPGSVSIPDASGSGIKATIYFDPHQKYIWENNRQRINMPMGAVTTGNTLYFKNLCSILRVNVYNRLGRDFDVMKLTAHAMGAAISGNIDVTLSEGGASMTPIAASENVLSLYNPSGESMGTISNGSSKSFDIVVPKFTNAKIVFEVEMYKHNTNGTYSAIGYFADTTGTEGAATGSAVSIDLNQIKTIDLDVDVAKTKTYDYGYLKPGPQFNDSIKALIREYLEDNPNTTITTIQFVNETSPLTLAGLYSWNAPGNIVDTTFCPTGWKVVSTPNSPHKIWAYISGTTVKINCWGQHIYANTNCREMFKGLTTITNILWNNGSQEGFITEDVTDMSSMFEECRALKTIDGIELFNTTNVTNMAYMFKGCSNLTGLTLSSFNTQNVTDNGMVGMFQNCSSLQTLNISSFTTARVTNMTNLFSGCTLLTTLDIRQFVISPNTTLTNMCYHLNYEHHWKDENGVFLYTQNNPVSQNRCNITCKTDTWNTIMGQAALPDADHPNYNPIDPTTGLDLRIVKKSDTNVGK